MSKRNAPPRPLYKQHSWAPDMHRDEAWLRRKGEYNNNGSLRRNKSVSDDDLEELRACIELGFVFDSPDTDPKLSDTIPALDFFYAVNKQYSNSLSRSSSSSSLSLVASDCENETPTTIIDQGDDAEMVKTRLRQWAQVVACTVRQSSSELDKKMVDKP